MKEVVFNVAREDQGGFSACWDDPLGGGISTQGNNLAHLEAMIEEAVFCHFDEDEIPSRIKLHFVEDPVLSIA